MRIINFGVKDDEIIYFKKYASQLNIECVLVREPLRTRNKNLLKDFDGVTDSMSSCYHPSIYEAMEYNDIKYFSLRSAGFDQLNCAIGNKYGVRFARVPSYSPNAIAEHAVGMTIMLLRNLHVGYNRFHNQDYRIDGLIGREIRDYTVGILGTGNIGLTTAKAFAGFGGRVIAYDVKPNQNAQKWLEYIDDFEQFLTKTSLLVICIPLTATNRHLINKKTLSLMPKNSILINIARGELVSSEDLYQALKSGQLAKAGIDVYENEAMIYHRDLSCQILEDDLFRKLESLPNVLITPHIGYNTHRAVENMVKVALENIVEMTKSDRIKNEIN